MSKPGNKHSIKRGDICWVKLDPTIGSEVKKTRPAVVISNNAQNMLGLRYIVAPVTSVVKKVYPFETLILIEGQKSKVMLDQVRTIDRRRLGSKIGTLSNEEIHAVDQILKVVLSLS